MKDIIESKAIFIEVNSFKTDIKTIKENRKKPGKNLKSLLIHTTALILTCVLIFIGVLIITRCEKLPLQTIM